ncbi:glycerophosphodiester phosphodiesterase [Halobacteriales archaeon QH_7_69_31]|nr:MAG: glycerophosphodiester phosphodiesterase [Halobacteriales archaeon QH_7_69_31]
MRLIAHRGFAAVNPENTLRAVRSAARVADAVEVDVRRCGSGELVVIHDATVDRVTDGAGPVADHTLAELGDVDVLGTGEGVPTLSAVLGAVPDDVAVNVELKEDGTAADALAAVNDSAADAWISAFDPDVLAACRSADASVPRALLARADGVAAIDTARKLDCAALHPAAGVCDGHLVDRAHAAGLAVDAWTVVRPGTARSLADRGVDGLIADRPDVLPDDGA